MQFEVETLVADHLEDCELLVFFGGGLFERVLRDTSEAARTILLELADHVLVVLLLLGLPQIWFALKAFVLVKRGVLLLTHGLVHSAF